MKKLANDCRRHSRQTLRISVSVSFVGTKADVLISNLNSMSGVTGYDMIF